MQLPPRQLPPTCPASLLIGSPPMRWSHCGMHLSPARNESNGSLMEEMSVADGDGGDHQYKKRLDEAQDGLITLKRGQILNLFLAWHFPLMNSEWMQDDLQVQNSPQPDKLTHCKPSTCNVFIYVCVSILCIYVITVNKHNNSICLIVQTNHILTYPHENFLPRPLHFLAGRRLENFWPIIIGLVGHRLFRFAVQLFVLTSQWSLECNHLWNLDGQFSIIFMEYFQRIDVTFFFHFLMPVMVQCIWHIPWSIFFHLVTSLPLRFLRPRQAALVAATRRTSSTHLHDLP